MTTADKTVAGLDVSRETLEKLHELDGLIRKWTKTINLIAPTTVDQIWDRHIVDSAQIFSYAKNWTIWTDLGSGGGLPGLVIAIMSGGHRPVTLIESDTRKCLFLNTVRRELELNVSVVNERIEQTDLPRSDVLSARALAPLKNLLVHAEKMLTNDGIALFSKGEKYQVELDEALKNWQFEYKAHQSHTNPDARILEISRISRREL